MNHNTNNIQEGNLNIDDSSNNGGQMQGPNLQGAFDEMPERLNVDESKDNPGQGGIQKNRGGYYS